MSRVLAFFVLWVFFAEVHALEIKMEFDEQTLRDVSPMRFKAELTLQKWNKEDQTWGESYGVKFSKKNFNPKTLSFVFQDLTEPVNFTTQSLLCFGTLRLSGQNIILEEVELHEDGPLPTLRIKQTIGGFVAGFDCRSAQ